jgi:hypothetical protein
MMLMLFKRQIEVRQTMKYCKEKSEIKVLRIDLAKQSFQFHGADGSGQTVLRKKLSRNKLTHLSPTCHRVLSDWKHVAAHITGRVHLLFWAHGTNDGPSVCKAIRQI